MKSSTILTIAVTLLTTAATPICGQVAAQDEPSATGDSLASQAPSADEVEIRKAINSYVEAFNQGDAKAVATHWSATGEFVTPAGDVLQGRQQLEDDFAAYFTATKNARIELPETMIEFLSPNVAVETGIARVLVPEQEPSESEYEAIHVKTADGWKIDSVREQEPPTPPPTHYDQLQVLEWMIGSWTNADDNSSVETTCRWTPNRNFLVRTFKVYIQDRVDFEGTQVIGWDPHVAAIRSWMFDSDGGFGVGRWSASDNRWTVQTLDVLHDGRRASATNIYDLVEEDTVQFQSIGRQVDGELMPSIEPVTFVRVTEP